MQPVYILVLTCCLGFIHEGQAVEKHVLPVGPPINQRSLRDVSSFANPGQPGRPGSGIPGQPGQGRPGQPGSPGGSGGAGGNGGTGGDGGAGGAGGRAARGGSYKIALGSRRRPESWSKYYVF